MLWELEVGSWELWRFSVFGALYAAEGTDPALLGSVAREFSPRIEVCGPREITLDLSGLERLFGEARTIAHELRRTAADRGLQVRVAIAGTRASRLLRRVVASVSPCSVNRPLGRIRGSVCPRGVVKAEKGAV